MGSSEFEGHGRLMAVMRKVKVFSVWSFSFILQPPVPPPPNKRHFIVTVFVCVFFTLGLGISRKTLVRFVPSLLSNPPSHPICTGQPHVSPTPSNSFLISPRSDHSLLRAHGKCAEFIDAAAAAGVGTKCCRLSPHLKKNNPPPSSCHLL